jgi:hypothetical protein
MTTQPEHQVTSRWRHYGTIWTCTCGESTTNAGPDGDAWRQAHYSPEQRARIEARR